MIDEKRLLEDLIHCKELGRRSFEAVIEAVKSQPKVGEWIPCSGCSDCKHEECEHHGKI